MLRRCSRLMRTRTPVGRVSNHEHSWHQHRVVDDAVDHGDERRLLGAAQALHRLEAGKLAVGARPSLDDLARPGDLGGAAEMVGVLGDKLEQLLHQLGEGHDRALAEIDHALASVP